MKGIVSRRRTISGRSPTLCAEMPPTRRLLQGKPGKGGHSVVAGVPPTRRLRQGTSGKGGHSVVAGVSPASLLGPRQLHMPACRSQPLQVTCVKSIVRNGYWQPVVSVPHPLEPARLSRRSLARRRILGWKERRRTAVSIKGGKATSCPSRSVRSQTAYIAESFPTRDLAETRCPLVGCGSVTS
jgi:hypothetical protein